MRNRQAVTRMSLRKLVRRGEITRVDMKAILRDEDALDAVAEMVQDSLDEEDKTFQDYSAEEDGPIIRFIKWIIENPEKVAVFIKLIISLFSDTLDQTSPK